MVFVLPENPLFAEFYAFGRLDLYHFLVAIRGRILESEIMNIAVFRSVFLQFALQSLKDIIIVKKQPA